MRKTESLACHCGEGSLEVEVLSFGKWQVERVLIACPACGSTDIEKARKAAPQDEKK